MPLLDSLHVHYAAEVSGNAERRITWVRRARGWFERSCRDVVMVEEDTLERLESAAVESHLYTLKTPGEASRQEEFILGGAEEHIAGAEERIAFASVVSSVFSTGTLGVPGA
ncbi:hypothetical protein MTO96_052069 [Rhipicephalus appendiculatus]